MQIENTVTGQIYGKTFRPCDGEVLGKQDEHGNWVLLADPAKLSPALLRMFQNARARRSQEMDRVLSGTE